MEIEVCVECEMETGNAGRDEDSLYLGESGPYCSQCYDDMVHALPSRITQLEADKLAIGVSLKNAYDHIQHEAYNDALSSILEALAQVKGDK